MNKYQIEEILDNMTSGYLADWQIKDTATEILKLLDQQQAEPTLDILARKLIEYLCKNYHPHVELTITPTGYELKEGLISSGQIMDYVED